MSLYSKIIDLQKLQLAWNKVHSKKPASGADSISYEDFDQNRINELKQLNLELVEHRYEVFPVKLVKLKKEEKIREVSLYTMRDKTVQVSIAKELNQILDRGFSKSTYAYRSDKSAMIAISEIEKEIVSENYGYVCKTDISGFFDTISHEKIQTMLKGRLKEEDVVELIMRQLKTPNVGIYGEMTEKQVGLYQGSAISPILSNLYMDSFDKAMEQEAFFFIRYSDDILFLAKTLEEATEGLSKIRVLLETLNLSMNQDKTYIKKLEEGFDFLGYHFDHTGKSIPGKAVEKLESSLEDVWLTMVGISLEERLKKGSQILNGWEQFYREEREITNIYEYVVVAYMMRYKKELQSFVPKRIHFQNKHKDIANYLIKIWSENQYYEFVRFEYEQFFEITKDLQLIQEKHCEQEIIGFYEELMEVESEEKWDCVMQAYADLRLYDHSEKVMERVLQRRTSEELIVSVNEKLEIDTEKVGFDLTTLDLMGNLFVGREDMHTREILTADHRRKSEFVAEPLTCDVIQNHLQGTEIVGTYLVRNNDTVHYIVLDIDICKKILLEEPNAIETHLNSALMVAMNTMKTLQKMGLKSYLEFSGYRGFHLWLFFSEWVPIRYAFSLLEIVQSMIKNTPNEITIEVFPEKGRKNTGSSGQNVKLPLGIHLLSGKRSYFLENETTPVEDINRYLSTIAKYSMENLKKVIGSNISTAGIEKNKQQKSIELDFGKLSHVPDSVLEVAKGCNLMQYLIHKAISTGYLSHLE